jgi:glutaredoxin
MINRGMNGEVGVRVLTLSDCDYCIWLKSELDSCGIAYVDIDANKFDEFSTKVEKEYKTDTYPIVFIETGKDTIVIVGETELDTTDKLRTFDTIPHLVNIIKKYIQ